MSRDFSPLSETAQASLSQRVTSRARPGADGALDAGKVYLVGAGPGDPELITVKGLRCLRQANVVVYDRLIAPDLLDEVRPGAELIFVGKGPEKHTLPQEEINALLVNRARQGLAVVRLKGGDPFVFGRGGEEAMALVQAGLPFEIVPGVSSALAVPAYAGIPVTHRDYSSLVTIVTGHERCNAGPAALNWRALAELGRLGGTLVILMGVAALPGIVEHLAAHGLTVETPVAVIQQGTVASQRTVIGMLKNIVDEVVASGLSAPAVIVIGSVVNLHDSLSWFEQTLAKQDTLVLGESATGCNS